MLYVQEKSLVLLASNLVSAPDKSNNRFFPTFQQNYDTIESNVRLQPKGCNLVDCEIADLLLRKHELDLCVTKLNRFYSL